MSAAQLLNPKAWAKEQATAKKDAAKKGAKDAPAQPQPRPQAPSQFQHQHQIQRPTGFDPKVLLNPGGASNTAADDERFDGDFGVGNLISRHHNLTDRAEAPAKRRKVMSSGDDDNDQLKKSRGPASHIGNGGGIISDSIKKSQDKEEDSQQPAQPSIDLTVDDDAQDDDDDDVQFVSEVLKPSKDNANEEVCLGVLHVSGNVHRIPAPSSSKTANALGREMWPPMRLIFKKENAANNIIDLYDPTRAKFGTLEARAAAALGPMITGAPTLKLRCIFSLPGRKRSQDEYPGMRVSQNVKVDATLFSSRQAADQIGKYLSKRQYFLTTPLISPGRPVLNPQMPKNYGPAVGGTSSTTRVSGTVTYVVRTAEEMRSQASMMFDKIMDDSKLPGMEADSAIIRTPLMDHQKKGLHFLVDHERASSEYKDVKELPSHSLWLPSDNGRNTWYHIITGHEVREMPEEIRGGILADVMGLGKTLSIMSLVAATQAASRQFRVTPASGALVNAKATLIICPKSVLSNWTEQIGAHSVPGMIKSYVYHGPGRTQDLEFLAAQDVVLTSYNTAAAEFGDGMGKKKALSSITWFRIVLDEAHGIRTQSTQVSKACCALKAERRWAVTGTPIQNGLSDLGTLVKFLRIKPFDDNHTWNQHINAKFKTGDVSVLEQLKLLVGSITLRREKDTVIVGKRVQTRVRLDPSPDEELLYNRFAKTSRTHFHNITGGGTAIRGKAYAHVLKSIGRLRAICAHGREMLSEEDMKEIEGDDPSNAMVVDLGEEPEFTKDDDFITEKQAFETFTAMQDSEVDSCQRCGEKLGKQADEAADTTTDEEKSDVDDESSSDDSSSDEDVSPKKRTRKVVKDTSKDNDLLGHLTPCFHVICAGCEAHHREEVKKTATADNHHDCSWCGNYVRFGMFPLRRSAIDRFVEARRASKLTKAAKWDEDTYTGPHTKVKALLENLAISAQQTAALPPGEPPVRSVVFSGWTSYLDLIEYALMRENIGFVRLDGTMSVKTRTANLNIFKNNDNITVLLASIKAAGQGLNLTSANKVYVMEPQFNPGVEEQAVDRVHRLGQKRDVEIVHYIMKGSVEEGILKLQEKKKNLAKLSMDRKKSKAEDSLQKMNDIKDLFK
ncbi:unnamed protein product [Zymoseptoria tritici ST99CH_3D1]|nr:unnamed protein product [Zymoseptoria tritici ST99CH_3D1]